MSDPKTRPEMTCAYCLGPAEGNYAVHRDGFCDGPEVDLCDACGGEETPSLADIWERIAERRHLLERQA